MKYKCFISVLIFIITTLVFFSCIDENKNKEKYIIGFSQCTSDSWRDAVLLEMQIEASNHKNVELMVYNASDNNSRQISQIRKLISQNVDILIISPNEAVPITDVAVEAYRKGIPTIIHDRKIQSDEYTVSIGANNYNIGQAIGSYINSILPAESTILEIWGLEGSSPAIERHDGFLSALDKSREYQIKQVYGKWHYNIAYEEIDKLNTYSDIDLVYAHNDAMALAARDLIMKKDPVSGNRINFIGIDGVYGDGAGLEAVAEGKLKASFQYPTGGAIAIQVAMDILEGKPTRKNYDLNTYIIDKSNAKTILAQSEQVNNYQQIINKQKAEENHLLSRFNFLRNSTIMIFILLILIIPLLTYVMYVNLRIKNKNTELYEKNLLVETQKEELAIKNKQIENVSRQKLQFFTNISHEIRTPVTLIIGPLDKLIKSNKIDPSLREDVDLIKRNVDRLSRIVNQILDFRRIDNDKMRLILRETDIVSLVKEIYGYFGGIASEKYIDYKFSSEVKNINLFVDVNKIEQVLVNIISNAFKYSTKKGKVTIQIVDKKDSVTISIEDNGRGITKEDQKYLFERFYTSSKNGGTAGFGIGLNLAKEYVDMHNGLITVESQPGEYTVFHITLFKGSDHFTSEYTLNQNDLMDYNTFETNIDNSVVNELLSKEYNYQLLVVEDDMDVRNYLKKELSVNFHVFTAENGKEALDILHEVEDISLIVSDVLMPEMNGFQLCKELKNDISISHIPIILLTALSEDSQRIYGIAGGADEYIQKPFNMDFFKIRILNIIRERKRIREKFKEYIKHGEINKDDEVNMIVGIDDLFRNNLLNIIEEFYNDSDFSIEELSVQIGLSRVHLYRKTKVLFGMSPTDLLRNYRLNKALVLLKQQQFNISEISYMSGFTSPAYFTKCFRELHKVTPTEYITSSNNKL